jgi:glycosyltransferase involved in cell wall biosynthesis
MRIGFINPWETFAPPDGGGSLGIWTWEVARRFAASSEVFVCGQGRPGAAAFDEVQGVRFFRWPVQLDNRLMRLMHRIRNGSGAVDVACWYYYYVLLVRAALLLRRHRCNVIHIFNLSQFAPVMARLNPQAAIVLNMHCDFLAGMDYSLIGRRLEFVDRIIGCADCITNDIRSRFPHHAARCDTIHNGVDLQLFRPPEAGSQGRASETLITVGRISPEKGLHVLLDAFERVVVRKPRVRLRVIGPESILYVPGAITKASSSNQLQKIFSACGEDYLQKLKERVDGALQENVSFIGPVAHHKVAAEMRNAAILVQPSLYETFGMPAIEAMASGLPVVASRVGGLPEIVSDAETGILVEPSDPVQLAEALVTLLDDPVRMHAMGAAARSRTSQIFSWEATVDRLRSCYERAINNRSAPRSACAPLPHDWNTTQNEQAIKGRRQFFRSAS